MTAIMVQPFITLTMFPKHSTVRDKYLIFLKYVMKCINLVIVK